MTKRWAIIGGTGFKYQDSVKILHKEAVETAFGQPSSPLIHAEYQGLPIIFLARHGEKHTIPPHMINYRANIQALADAGVTHIFSLAAVGGITPDMSPKALAVPDQIVDYTWGREQTFFNDFSQAMVHIDFTEPYCESLRQMILTTAKETHQQIVSYGTYAATQGPRLESAAEIIKLERDGCDLVGMTGMPEAGLAREAGLCYAHVAMVANWAAGKQAGVISMQEIDDNLVSSMQAAETLILATISQHD